MIFLKVSIYLPLFQLEKLIDKNYFLNKSAHEGYKAYIRAYASHSLKNIFDVHTVDLQKVALSFGFKTPPFVDLSILWNFKSHVEIHLVSQLIQ